MRVTGRRFSHRVTVSRAPSLHRGSEPAQRGGIRRRGVEDPEVMALAFGGVGRPADEGVVVECRRGSLLSTGWIAVEVSILAAEIEEEADLRCLRLVVRFQCGWPVFAREVGA